MQVRAVHIVDASAITCRVRLRRRSSLEHLAGSVMPILVSMRSDRARCDLVTDTEKLQPVDGVRRHQYAGAELIWCAHALIERCAKAVTLKRQGRAQASNSRPHDENVSNGISRQTSHHSCSGSDLTKKLFEPPGWLPIPQVVSILMITNSTVNSLSNDHRRART